MPRISDATSRQPEEHAASHPLTSSQSRILFLESLTPDTSHHLVPLLVRIRGALDEARFEHCLSQLPSHIPVLRLAVSVEDIDARQYVRRGPSYEFESHDIRQQGPPEPAVERILNQRALRPMALEGPFVRFVLIRLDEDAWTFCLVLHRLLGDEPLAAEAYRLLVALYAGRPMPDAPADEEAFRRTVAEQRYLASDAAAADVDFWREYLTGAPSALDLATDLPRPPVQRMNTHRARCDFSQEPLTRWRAWLDTSQEQEWIPCLTALAALLFRYTRQADLVLGLVLRRPDGTTILPLRLSLMPFTPFRDLAVQVKRQFERCIVHGGIPFDRVLEAVQPERNLSRAPVFQVALDWCDRSPEPATTGDVTFTPDDLDAGWSELDLGLVVSATSGGFKGVFEVNAGLFDPATAARMTRHFDVLLRGASEAPETPLSALPMLSPEEREQLLVTWNAERLDYPHQVCIHELIAREAVRYPDHVALVWNGQRMTYGELDRRANQLAHFLKALKVGPEVFVGVCMERRPDLVIALLAVMKAGGAYVPLDPRYPADRIAFMLQDTKAPVVLTDAAIAPSLPPGDSEIIAVDALRESIAMMAETPPETSVRSDNLAYVIYTSGSTGVPKGVAITHRPGIALFFWARRIFTDADLRGMLASTSVCFDLSVFELFFPLCFGGRIVLVDNVLEILDSPSSREVTLINTVPSAMNELIRLDGVPASVTTVCLAGEPLPPTLAGAIYALPHVTHLYNLYGPSEDTTYSTWVLVPRGKEPRVTIGRPIANTQAYVLDPEMQPVPVGVPGELYLGGDGLARGYHGRPELTDARFVRNPFDSDASSRAYRTGDLVKYLADGQLFYLGRLDHQVKIRGFRIELGEIQTVLERHDGVREAAVVVREDAPGDKRIVGYVALSDRRCTVDTLRRHLGAFLPPYMIPSAFVVMDALPRTPNGKLDRNALPAPAASDTNEAEEAFASSIERSIAALWREVLPARPISRRDSFFALGGHSLLATQVTARVREAFGVAVPLRTIFERPSLIAYAQAVTELVESGARDTSGKILALPYSEPEPLSYAQEGLWFLDQYQPGLAAYVIPVAYRLRGTLNVSALEDAIHRVMACHEALRTYFVFQNGRPMQAICSEARVALDVVDMQHVPTEAREHEAMTRAAAAGAVPFDLNTAPLMRAILYRLFDDDYLLFLPQHHIVSDGWSLSVLTESLAAAYAEACRGSDNPLPRPKYQYRDFARWQRALLVGDGVARLTAYWRERLAGAPPALDLVTDYPRPRVPSFCGAREPIALSDSLAREITGWCRELNTTPYTVLLAAVFGLMYRYTNQATVVLGAAVANRDRPEWEGVYGYFVNSLPVREDLSASLTFSELVRSVHAHLIGVREHQDLPFDKIVEAVLPERDPSRHPLFQVMVVLQNTPSPCAGADGMQFQASEWANGTSKFDLTFSLQERRDSFDGYLEYDTALFKAATVRRMAGHLREMLQSGLRNPETPIARLEMLTPDERRQLLAWAETHTQYPRESSVSRLFENQAARTPDAIAMSGSGTQWTYRELNERANRLAHRLIKDGVRPGDFVGLSASRSPELVAAILGIVKAGAAYVPLDPEYPAERLSFMVGHAGIHIAVCDAAAGSTLPDGVRSIHVDTFWETHGDLSSGNPHVDVAANDPVYIMFTSGSTGTPKGVVVPHRAVVRLVCNTNYISVAHDDTFLLMAPISFDASTFEIWGALLHGACLAIMPPEPVSIARLKAAIVREKVTVLWLTAGLFHVVVDEDIATLRPLRWLLAGGDVLRPDAVRRCLEAHPHCTVINGYGPTENTTFTCCFLMTSPEQVGDDVSIGRPIANTTAYVMDTERQLAPIGVPGELFTGGDGLALGYHRDPELTGARFIRNPFSNRAGDRLYRTGDRVRYREDGTIEFLGRMDTQVKVRGFRIEPEEIELVLLQHDAVRGAAVIAAATGNGEKQLHAFVVGDAIDGRLIEYLRVRLPEYMIPSAFHAIEALPLSPNGKVDRKALSQRIMPFSARPECSVEPPQGALEHDIAGLWEGLLGSSSVGRHDNFFTLGGHSLLATQMTARLSSACGIDVPVRAVFEHPTVAGLARAVEALEVREESEAIPDMATVPRDGALLLSYTQRRLWFLEQLLGSSPAYVIPAVLRMEGPLDRAALQRAVEALVARHEILRAVFIEEDGQPAMRVRETIDSGIRVTELDASSGGDTERLVQRVLDSEAATPFNLVHGPLIRFHLVAARSDVHYLAMPVHHIVSDGWSQQILFRELSELYTAQCAGRAAILPSLPLQYADYATWQRAWLQGAPLHRRLTFWRTHLEGAPFVLELPTDHVRPPVQHPVGRRHAFTLAPDTLAQLREYCRAHGVTPYVVLLAAFYALLSRLSGRDDLIVGSVMANRRQLALQSMVGFFANTLALRARVERDTSFAMLVASVHDQVLAAHDHQDLPLDVLVDALHPKRDRSRNPLIQVIFSLNNVSAKSWQADALHVSPLELDNGSSKFDLSLLMEERPDEIDGFIEYNTELFRADTIARWATLFERVLRSAMEHKHDALHTLASPVNELTPVPIDSQANDLGDCIAAAEERAPRDEPDIAVATPAQAAQWLAQGALPKDVRVVCLTGAVVPPPLIARILRRKHVQRVVCLFGTAVCPAATAAVVDAGGPVDYLAYQPIGAVRVEVRDQHGMHQILDVPGELFIHDGTQWTAAGVRARQAADGRIRILGSTGDFAVLGGVTIDPHEIERVLLAHDDVWEACAVIRGDASVTAYVATDETMAVGSLQDYVRDRLPDLCVPSHIVRLDKLPLTPKGLHDLAALADIPVEEPAIESSQATDVEQQLTVLWRELLHVSSIARDDDFFDLGGHSLLATQLLARLRKDFGIHITLDDIYARPTVEGLARYIAAPHTGESTVVRALDPCLVAIKATGARRPFFCVSGAGGPVYSYFNLAPYLHPEQPFFGLQAPSLEDRTQHFDRIEDLAAYYVRAIQGRQPSGPYLIGGWSFGGAVAFEIARQLRDQGCEVAFVGLIDAEATVPPRTAWERTRLVSRVLAEKLRGRSTMTLHTLPLLARYLRDGVRMIMGRARKTAERDVPLRDYVRWVIRDQASQYFLRQAKIVQVDALTSRADVLNDDRVRLITDVFTANEAMLRKYAFEPYDGPVTLFRAKHDPWRRRAKLGWDDVATDVVVHALDGNHLVIFRTPFVRELGEKLDRCLAEAQGLESQP